MFLHADIGKNRLNDLQPSGIDPLALGRVNLCFHFIDQIGWLIGLNGKVLAGRCRLAQTPGSCGAGSTIFLTSVVDIIGAIAVGLVAGMAGELLSLRANVNLVGRIKGEIGGREGIRLERL